MADTTWFALNGYDDPVGRPLDLGQLADRARAAPGAAKGWTFWQYTSDGVVPGISGRVDLNRYNGTNFTKVLIP